MSRYWSNFSSSISIKSNCIFFNNWTIFCFICHICSYYFCRHIYHISGIWILSNFLQPSIKIISLFIWSCWYDDICTSWTIIILSIIIFISWIHFYHRCSIIIYKCYRIFIYSFIIFCIIYHITCYSFFIQIYINNTLWSTLCPISKTISILRIWSFIGIWYICNISSHCSSWHTRNTHIRVIII